MCVPPTVPDERPFPATSALALHLCPEGDPILLLGSGAGSGFFTRLS
jgi:hypothetical protein